MNRTVRWSIAGLSVGVAAYAIGAYALLPLGSVLHPDIRSSFEAHRLAWVYLHVFGAALALLLGPWQFQAALRARWPRLHRWAGRVYLAAGVGVGGLSGLALAFNAYGGLVARSGFGLLALLWLATGALALSAILRGDVAAHRLWMVRNFALTLAAVALRLYLPAAIVGGLSLAVAYPVVAWLCWVPNLVAAEWLLRRASNRQRDSRPCVFDPMAAPAGRGQHRSPAVDLTLAHAPAAAPHRPAPLQPAGRADAAGTARRHAARPSVHRLGAVRR